jgi:hypothetical protein
VTTNALSTTGALKGLQERTFLFVDGGRSLGADPYDNAVL